MYTIHLYKQKYTRTMGMDFAHTHEPVQSDCTFKQFTDEHECTWGAVRSFVKNRFEFAPSTNALVPVHVLDALNKKYPKRETSSPAVKPVHNVAPALLPAKKQPIRQERPQEKPNPVIEYVKTLGLSDLIIWITSCVTLYGCTSLFAEMGAIAGTLYTLVVLLILHISKKPKYRKTASGAVYFLYVMEFAAVFVHTSMFNQRIWNNAGEMMFTPEHGSKTPFFCALVFGLFICAFSIFAVTIKLSQVREVSDSEFYGA